MTTIEDRLRDLGRTVTPPSLPGASTVMLRARQRRRRRRGRLAALVVAAGTGTGVAARTLRPDDGSTVRIAPAVPTDDGSGPSAPPTVPTSTGPLTTEPGYIVVPNVLGLRVDEARTIMEDLGFLVRIVGDVDDAALVVSQAPAAGIDVAIGAEIRLGAG